jgi:hypothetical protein
MYAYGNHICVSNVEEHLRINDCGVTTTFEQECISSRNDHNIILAKYVGQVLELNYGVFNKIVLLCNWVKANYTGSSATIKRNEYGFTLVDFFPLFPFPICNLLSLYTLSKFFFLVTQKNEGGR